MNSNTIAENDKGEPPGEWSDRLLGDVTTLLTGFPFKSSQYTDDASGRRWSRSK